MTRDYLICLVENEYFGFDLEIVLKIIECKPLTKIAGESLYVDGAMNYEGEVLKVINLRRALGKKESEESCQKMVVLNKDGRYFAMKVDGIDKIVPHNSQSAKNVGLKEVERVGIFEVPELVEIDGKLVSIVKDIFL